MAQEHKKSPWGDSIEIAMSRFTFPVSGNSAVLQTSAELDGKVEVVRRYDVYKRCQWHPGNQSKTKENLKKVTEKETFVDEALLEAL